MPINPFFFDRRDVFTGRRRRREDQPVSSPFRTSVIDAPEQSYETRDARSYLDEVRDAYLGETPARSEYREHVMNMPQRQPSTWRDKLSGALIGAGIGYTQGPAAGYSAARSRLEEPYALEHEQWSMREQGLRQIAEMEDDQMQRRLGYLREVRAVAKDEAEVDQAMRKYDLDVANQKATAQWRQGQLDERALDRESRERIAGEVDIDRDLSREALIKHQAGTRAIQSRQAGAAESRAATAATRAAQGPRAGNRRSQILELRDADQQAVNDAIRENPHWENFFDEQGRVKRRLTEAERKSFEVFRRTVEAKRAAILAAAGIGADDDVDFEIR